MDQKIRRVHSAAFKARVAVEALKEQKTIVELSGMDGRGRAMDNIFTERLWRSLKYEEVKI